MAGWYRMHRGWMEHKVFVGEPFSRRDAFQWLIQEAVFKATDVRLQNGVVTLDRGQVGHSIRFMAKAWKWDEKKVRRFLEVLRASEIIASGTAAGQTVVTICNYDKYQATDCGAAADDAAATPQPRRGGAANIKKEEERKEEGSRAGAREPYFFEGQTVRLTQKNFDQWAASFHAIPDLRAELAAIDAWWQGQPEAKRAGWFQRTSGMLNRKHQERVAEAGPGVDAMCDAADRRYERLHGEPMPPTPRLRLVS